MAGSLVLIDSETASDSASISLTGISSTYDVYLCVLNGITPTADANFNMRVTTSGSPDDDSQKQIHLLELQVILMKLNGELIVQLEQTQMKKPIILYIYLILITLLNIVFIQMKVQS